MKSINRKGRKGFGPVLCAFASLRDFFELLLISSGVKKYNGICDFFPL
jgi:hypothetical protein